MHPMKLFQAVFRTRTIMNKAIIRTVLTIFSDGSFHGITDTLSMCCTRNCCLRIQLTLLSTDFHGREVRVYVINERFFKPETHLAQKERRQACVQRIAEMCARRIEWPNSRRAPLVSDELLSILIDEVKKKHRRKPRSVEEILEHGRAQCVELNAFECWEDLGWIHDRLRLLVEDMVDRYSPLLSLSIISCCLREPFSTYDFICD
uniref:Uncharacterized protein n=1 Tax=Parascaris equorum TaxID=6256 RepID=A0A914REM2_PAREQ